MIGDKGHLGHKTSIMNVTFLDVPQQVKQPKNKVVKFTVNGRWHERASNKVTYQDICIIAYGKVINGLTCTWSGKSGKGGTLSWNDEGYPLTIKDGTHFNIISTSNS